MAAPRKARAAAASVVVVQHLPKVGAEGRGDGFGGTVTAMMAASAVMAILVTRLAASTKAKGRKGWRRCGGRVQPREEFCW